MEALSPMSPVYFRSVRGHRLAVRRSQVPPPLRHFTSASSHAAIACRSGTHARPDFASEDTASGVTTTSSRAGRLASARCERPGQLLGALHTLAMKTESARHGGMVGELQPRADHLAVRLLLVAHFDRPAAVVGDDDEDRHLVARRGVDLHGVEAE